MKTGNQVQRTHHSITIIPSTSTEYLQNIKRRKDNYYFQINETSEPDTDEEYVTMVRMIIPLAPPMHGE